MKRDLYSEVSARILAELETGAAPWVKPWSATPGANVPCNAVTGRPYSGTNVVLLWMTTRAAGYASARYLTFNQAKAAGGHVRKGEKGSTVYFVKRLEFTKRDEAGEDEKKSAMLLRAFTVFNVSQCEGLPDAVVNGKGKVVVRNTDERDSLMDEFIAATGADFREGNGEAFYVPSKDFISMPAFRAFKSAVQFYNVSFHELGHWTGAKVRLDRDLSNRFGDQAYAAEELVAELCAAFLCAEFDLDGELRHAGYIATWIDLLKSDPKAFFTACSKAQAAADFLRSAVLADGVSEEPEALAA